MFLESVHKDLRDDSLEEKKSKSGKSGRDSDTPLNGITTTDLQAFQIAKGSFLDFLRYIILKYRKSIQVHIQLF